MYQCLDVRTLRKKIVRRARLCHYRRTRTYRPRCNKAETHATTNNCCHKQPCIQPEVCLADMSRERRDCWLCMQEKRTSVD